MCQGKPEDFFQSTPPFFLLLFLVTSVIYHHFPERCHCRAPFCPVVLPDPGTTPTFFPFFRRFAPPSRCMAAWSFFFPSAQQERPSPLPRFSSPPWFSAIGAFVVSPVWRNVFAPPRQRGVCFGLQASTDVLFSPVPPFLPVCFAYFDADTSPFAPSQFGLYFWSCLPTTPFLFLWSVFCRMLPAELHVRRPSPHAPVKYLEHFLGLCIPLIVACWMGSRFIVTPPSFQITCLLCPRTLQRLPSCFPLCFFKAFQFFEAFLMLKQPSPVCFDFPLACSSPWLPIAGSF